MRTAIFMGMNMIAMAITQSVGIHDVEMSEQATMVCAWALVAFLSMDIIDFARGKE